MIEDNKLLREEISSSNQKAELAREEADKKAELAREEADKKAELTREEMNAQLAKITSLIEQ